MDVAKCVIPLAVLVLCGASGLAENLPSRGPTLILFGGRGRIGADADGDGLPDAWELAHGLDASDATDAAGDVDGDGIAAGQEWRLGSDPWAMDSDGDGVPDGRMGPGVAVHAQREDDGNLLGLAVYRPGVRARAVVGVAEGGL